MKTLCKREIKALEMYHHTFCPFLAQKCPIFQIFTLQALHVCITYNEPRHLACLCLENV